MIPFRIAVPSAPFHNTLRLAIQSAAATGATGVQFDVRTEVRPTEFGDTARQQLRHYLAEFGLQIASTTLPTQGTLTDPDRLDRRVAAIREAMDFSRKLGASTLTVRLGTLPPETESPEYERLLNVLGDLAGYGNRIGCTPAVSTLGNTPAALQTLLTAVRRDGPLGLDFDPAGFVFAARSPASACRDLHSLIEHIQIRDGLRTDEGAGIETALGTGAVAWDEFLATVAEADYHGWLTLRRTGGDNIPTDLARGVQYVRNVLNDR